jgi:hypothetical protein
LGVYGFGCNDHLQISNDITVKQFKTPTLIEIPNNDKIIKIFCGILSNFNFFVSGLKI